MRYAVLGMLLLFALGDGCSPPPNVVGVQDFGHVTGRVLDAMTNRPIANALLSVGSLYTTRADVNGGFTLRAVAGDQTVTARAAGYATVTADTTITKDYDRVDRIHPPGAAHHPAGPADVAASGDSDAVGLAKPGRHNDAERRGEPIGNGVPHAFLIGRLAVDRLTDAT